MNHTGASACYICPEGYYCVNRDHADICPQGYYCPTGTGADWQLCPVGTFGNTTGLSEEAHCTFCTGVFLCVREREGEEKRKNPQVRENKSQTSLRILNCVLCMCVCSYFRGSLLQYPRHICSQRWMCCWLLLWVWCWHGNTNRHLTAHWGRRRVPSWVLLPQRYHPAHQLPLRHLHYYNQWVFIPCSQV